MTTERRTRPPAEAWREGRPLWSRADDESLLDDLAKWDARVVRHGLDPATHRATTGKLMGEGVVGISAEKNGDGNTTLLSITVRSPARTNGFCSRIQVAITNASDPKSPTFSAKLVSPATDAPKFNPNRGWTLNPTTGELTTPYLGRPPTDVIPYDLVAVDQSTFSREQREWYGTKRRVFDEEMMGTISVAKGPSGFLKISYSEIVLFCAVAWAFDPVIDDDDPWDFLDAVSLTEPPPPLLAPPTKLSLTRAVASQPKYSTKMEDGHVNARDDSTGLTMMAAVDGHMGDAAMNVVTASAWDVFLRAFTVEVQTSRTRCGAIRRALRKMHADLDAMLLEEHAKRVVQNEECRRVTKRLVSWDPAFDPPPSSPSPSEEAPATTASSKEATFELGPEHITSPGAVACFVVIDERTAQMHVSTVGDCFVAMIPTKETCAAAKITHPTVMSAHHESSSPAEIARIMLAGGYVTRNGRDDRVLGNFMPSRAMGDEDIKDLRPGSISSEPQLAFHQLSSTSGMDDVVVVATDGLYPGSTYGQYCYWPSLKPGVPEQAAVDEFAARVFDSWRSDNFDDRLCVLGKLSWA